MDEIEIMAMLPPVADYNRLRRSVGWGDYPAEEAAAALGRSLYAGCACLRGEVVGMARVVGDGGLAFYVQDVVVDPAQQRRGIGGRLMAQVMAYVAAHALPGAVVGLMAAKGKEPFYERYGFAARPSERYGCGMTQFWRPPDE
jgi:GNAT superfamily N-acetyltransferase